MHWVETFQAKTRFLTQYRGLCQRFWGEMHSSAKPVMMGFVLGGGRLGQAW